MDHDLERKITIRVKKLRHFYTSLISYLIVNATLFVINILTNPQNLWFLWVAGIWGLVLFVKGLSLFTIRDRVLGDEWEERKKQELWNKEVARRNRKS